LGFLYIIDTVFDAGSAWLVSFFVGANPEDIQCYTELKNGLDAAE
jgi:hypothetical protein